MLEEEVEGRPAGSVVVDGEGLAGDEMVFRGGESSSLREGTRRYVSSPVNEGVGRQVQTGYGEEGEESKSDSEEEDLLAGMAGRQDISNRDLMIGMMGVFSKLCKSQAKASRGETWNGFGLVNTIASYKEGTDMNKYVRGLEVELRDLGIKEKRWKCILLSKLPAKVKETVLDVVEESGCTYSRLKEVLVGRVGYRLRDLELKLFTDLDRDTRSMDRMSRFKHISHLVDRVAMICGTMDLVKGLFSTQLSVMEQGVVNATKVEKLSNLGDIASTLRDSGSSRTSSRQSQQETKCYRCQQLGHRSFECTAKLDERRTSPSSYVCNQLGHKSWDCPNKTPKSKSGKSNSKVPVKSGGPPAKKVNWMTVEEVGKLIDGKVNGMSCTIAPDRGGSDIGPRPPCV